LRYTAIVSVGEAPNRRPSRLGRYELITQIGEGGMAEVQLALQRGPAGFEKLVVVKLVHANLATQKTFVDMLLDEARIAALVKHPNVVDIYDLGEADGRYFIAMEYLEGEPLLAVLRAGREGKRLDPLSTARLIADTAEGLDAAHELRSMAGDPIELVHHDVSLGNIVVLYNGQVKLVDFGVAKASMSAAGPAKIQGKFSYMAPEKLKGGSGDRRSDIWSLGCVLWEALTLRRLFKGGNDADTMKQVLEQTIPPPSTVNGDVIAAFDPIVMRALERDPGKRYATAKAMAQDLEDVLLKQGYGGRNDQIARYMQTTFEPHIEARKKLLQEVSSKGRASADILEAAFAAPPKSSVRTSGEFSIAVKLPTPVHAEGTPSHGTVNTGEDAATLLDAPLISDEDADQLLGATEPVQSTSQRAAEYRRMYLGLGAIATVLVVVIVVSVAIALRGGSKTTAEDAGAMADRFEPAATPDTAGVIPIDAEEATPDAAEAPVDAEVVAVDAPVVDAAVTVDAAPKVDAGVVVIAPRRPTANELTTQGLRALTTGNYTTAITAFRRAVATTASWAPAWRGLGVTYEKLGQKGAAITAYQRYLAHAPRAPDAAAIRERIDHLKGK